MSMVGYYARVSADQLERLLAAPDDIWQLFDASQTVFAGAQGLDVDGAFQPIAWLLTEYERLNSEYMTQLIKLDGAELGEEQRAMLARLRAMDPGLVWAALYGFKAWFDDRISFGLGPASIVQLNDVRTLSAALPQEDALDQHYDPGEMDRNEVWPNCWKDEGDDLMNTLVRPKFALLKRFYADAAANGQVVLIGRG